MNVPQIHSAWCPSCRELVSAFDAQGLCMFCGEQTGGATPTAPIAASRPTAGRPYLMSEAQIMEARVLYASGLSLRAVARELHPRTAYRSIDSLARAIDEQFSLRGWALRDHAAVTRARNWRHGLKVRGASTAAYSRFRRAQTSVACAGVRTNYPGRGKPCRLPAARGSAYCQAHDPARSAEREAHLRAMRARLGRAA